MLTALLSVCCGACAGACLRWLCNELLNPLFSAFPLGTLFVNWLGSFIMGILLGLFALFPGAGPQWKLLLITGFLGSFTTFSAFAGEMTQLLLTGRYLVCATAICLHVIGSILLVFAGLGGVSFFRKAFLG